MQIEANVMASVKTEVVTMLTVDTSTSKVEATLASMLKEIQTVTRVQNDLKNDLNEYLLQNLTRRMWSNASKAIKEHRNQTAAEAYADLPEALLSFEVFLNPVKYEQPLKVSHKVSEAQGNRDAMEDANFYLEDELGVFSGVLDGHGGNEVANFSKQFMVANFAEIFKQQQGNIHATFCELIQKAHQEVIKNPKWSERGTTAVICYVDKKTHLVYTATLGDSEANLYRIINGNMKSISLSCLRNWSSPKDALRASIAKNMPEIASSWPKEKNPKRLRHVGLNVSRAIGDFYIIRCTTEPTVSQKPKITVNKLQPGDVLVLSCDGLKDFVNEEKIVNEIAAYRAGKVVDLAKHLTDYALKVGSSDNITVVAIDIASSLE